MISCKEHCMNYQDTKVLSTHLFLLGYSTTSNTENIPNSVTTRSTTTVITTATSVTGKNEISDAIRTGDPIKGM